MKLGEEPVRGSDQCRSTGSVVALTRSPAGLESTRSGRHPRASSCTQASQTAKVTHVAMPRPRPAWHCGDTVVRIRPARCGAGRRGLGIPNSRYALRLRGLLTRGWSGGGGTGSGRGVGIDHARARDRPGCACTGRGTRRAAGTDGAWRSVRRSAGWSAASIVVGAGRFASRLRAGAARASRGELVVLSHFRTTVPARDAGRRWPSAMVSVVRWRRHAPAPPKGSRRATAWRMITDDHQRDDPPGSARAEAGWWVCSQRLA